jgi:acyl-CoA thioester hydrolase
MTTPLELRMDIRWADLDSSRHVNNAVYLAYLEQVRTQWVIQSLGPELDPYEFVLVRVAIDYRRELTLADRAVIASCRLERIGTASLTTHEEVRNEAGDLAAEAECVLVAWNQAEGKSRPLTDAERAALS